MIQMTVIELSDSLSHVALSGQMDVRGVDEISLSFSSHTAARHKPTLVDLTHLDFIASLGIATLVEVARTLGRHELGMVLVNPKPLVRNTLISCGIDQVIPIAADTHEAMKYLVSPRPFGAAVRSSET